eukprot:5203934-Amphidinium_carterae.1
MSPLRIYWRGDTCSAGRLAFGSSSNPARNVVNFLLDVRYPVPSINWTTYGSASPTIDITRTTGELHVKVPSHYSCPG